MTIAKIYDVPWAKLLYIQNRFLFYVCFLTKVHRPIVEREKTWGTRQNLSWVRDLVLSEDQLVLV